MFSENLKVGAEFYFVKSMIILLENKSIRRKHPYDKKGRGFRAFQNIYLRNLDRKKYVLVLVFHSFEILCFRNKRFNLFLVFFYLDRLRPDSPLKKESL